MPSISIVQFLDPLVPKGKDTKQYVVDFVNEHGQESAAHHFGVTQSTISRWLREWGYTRQYSYVKEEESAS